MFLFAWFGFDLPEGAPDVNGFDAFDSFSDWINLILVFAAFAGIALALTGSGAERMPVSLSVIATVLGGIGAIVVLIYYHQPPRASKRRRNSTSIARSASSSACSSWSRSPPAAT